MSEFDLEKMVGTVDNLSICLNSLLSCNEIESREDILNSWGQLDSLITLFDDQMNVFKELLTKKKKYSSIIVSKTTGRVENDRGKM